MIVGQKPRPLVTLKTAAKVLEYTHSLSAPILPSRKRMFALIVQFGYCTVSHVVCGRPKQRKADSVDSVDGYCDRGGKTKWSEFVKCVRTKERQWLSDEYCTTAALCIGEVAP